MYRVLLASVDRREIKVTSDDVATKDQWSVNTD